MKKSLGARTLAFPTPVWLVATYDADGNPNVMTAAWAAIVCSKPPSVGVSLRKATYSYGNLVARKAFTVNIPSEKHVREADYCGIASGREVNKFAKCGFTAVKSDLVDAPYIQECPLVLECQLIHTVEIGLHTQFIGEILDVKADPEVLGEKRLPEIEKIKPIIFGPEIRTYHGIGAYLGQAFAIGKDL
jgi:flavin reductase (DIM6/NTAB) family NADH-FMN oxidoreductase RutF|uniref:Flavin reductase family protein n=1 Tax=Desulfobacca acetoxidans TaxID=60893 RepID=A0A7C5EWU3_9BACT